MAVWQDWFTDSTGRVMHPEKQILLLGWARSGLTNKDIAKNIGIAEPTVGVWKRKYPVFKAVLKNGREVADYTVENALFKKAVEGDTTAMIFWLKNRMPDKWQNSIRADKEMRELEKRIKQSQAKIMEDTAAKITASQENQQQIIDLIKLGQAVMGGDEE